MANEIWDALIELPRLPNEARKVLFAVIRKTYGFNKKWDEISLSQMCLMTKLKRSKVIRGREICIAMNLITLQGNGNSVSYCFNKDLDTWKSFPRKGTVPQQGNESSPTRERGGVPNKGHTKDNSIKYKYKDNNIVGLSPNKEIIIYFADKFKEVHNGQECLIEWPRDGAIVKKLLGRFSLDEIKARIDRFFDVNTTDFVIRKATKNIPSLKKHWDRLIKTETPEERLDRELREELDGQK